MARQIEVHEPLLLLGTCNDWGKDLEKARRQFRFEALPLNRGGEEELESHLEVFLPTSKVSFQIVSAERLWDWRLHPVADSPTAKDLRAGRRVGAQLSRDKDDKSAHGRNFRIQQAGSNVVDIGVLLGQRHARVWFTCLAPREAPREAPRQPEADPWLAEALADGALGASLVQAMGEKSRKPKAAGQGLEQAVLRLLHALAEAYSDPACQAEVAQLHKSAIPDRVEWLAALEPVVQRAQGPVFRRFGIPVGRQGVFLMKAAIKLFSRRSRAVEKLAAETRDLLGLAPSAKTEAPAPAEKADCFEELAGRMAAAGAFVSPKLARGSVPPLGVLGVVAREPIEAGEVLCRVPAGLCVTAETVKEAAPALCSAMAAVPEAVLPPRRRSDAAAAVLLSRLLHAAEASQRGREPREGIAPGLDAARRRAWESYALLLCGVDFSSHPCLQAAEPEKFRAPLDPSPAAEFVIDVWSDVLTMHKVLLEHCPEEVCESEVDLGKFVRARLCLITRWCGAAVRSAGTGSLVPVFDLFNHAAGRSPGVEWSWDEEEDGMLVRAVLAHEPGEELFISYGPHSNAVLFGTYGFTQAPAVEPCWSYWVSPDQIWKFVEELLQPPPDELRSQQVFLYSDRADDTLRAALAAAAAGGADRPSFLRELCQHCLARFAADVPLRPVVAALARTRAGAPGSGAWWAALGEEEAALAESEAARVKMSGYLCLLSHLEALDLIAGRLPAERCLDAARGLSEGLAQVLCG